MKTKKKKKSKKIPPGGIELYKYCLTELGYDQYEIKDRIYQYKTLKGWTAITVKELSEMKEPELKKLLSFCWHDGETRCDCIGIQDVKIIPSHSEGNFNVEWSDMNGDPNIYGLSMDDKIDNVGDGTWNYGLYKKK
jgi:hypothetical protein